MACSNGWRDAQREGIGRVWCLQCVFSEMTLKTEDWLMTLAINPGFDKSTRHGYQDCNVDHQAHCKWWNLCCTFTPRLLDAYRLWKKRWIPALCVTYCHLSDEKFLCQNVGLGSSTQHGRRSVGDEGDASPHFSAWGGQHRKCPHTFFSSYNKFKGLYYSETDHSLLL